MHRYRYGLAALALAAFKLWLVGVQTRPAFAFAVHDDRLFVDLAASLAAGDWLGRFNHVTLVKGPVYPLWLAFCHALSLPSFLMQHLLYIAACLLFVAVVGRWLGGPRIRLLLFGTMLFNPATCAFMVVHFKRESIYGSLSILLFAGLAGLYCASRYRERELIGWAALAGAALAAFWLTREEGLWLVPSALVLAAFAGYRLWRRRPENRLRILVIYLLPLAIWAASQLTVAWINHREYGIFVANELKSKSFRAAYGALTRVEHESWRPFNPVPKETRLRIYEVSPSFAELEPYLEGDLGRRWGKHGRRLLRGGDAEGEIAGGWFLWALRAAVEAAGYYRDGPRTLDYYDRLAAEVNRACDEGKLRAGRRRATLAPPLRSEYVKPFLGVLPKAFPVVARWKGAEPLIAAASRGRSQDIALFREISGDRIAPAGEPRRPEGWLDRFRVRTLKAVWWIYHRCGGVLTALALAAYAGSAALMLRAPLRGLFAVNTALAAGIVAQVAMVCLLHVTSFPSINVKYLSPALLLVAPLIVLSLADFATLLRSRIGAPTKET